ncbi:hypothetical protein BBBOND_0111420 [Babesia bigemina]|uniref:C3H1-type domain-containing protein n=1 Tax=Babesia bigemina TaxID=5866 RepID=A0A061D2M1_BABBI|nr:hypothetical protein BBBOND_0111420 [Babesia bigemina]CDR94843.1 hypothetical protein BBBOND_0111420 [Babesia bigemina]|eukprot:XP_012767029.1 hypothetical protein BBBOND_0111420 [Babesia bigemina]
MGFLSGVLGAVKNENEVTTYDNYISDENKKLNKVLEKLTKNIGSGRDGLAEAVDAVKEWLEGYEKKLDEKNKKITSPLNTLITEIDARMKDIPGKRNEDYDSVSGNFAAWLMGVRRLASKPSVSADRVKKLDPKLSGELSPHVDMVSQAVNTFVDNAKRDRKELETACSKVQVELRELEREVTAYTTFKNGKCVEVLQEEFDDKIKRPIENVKSMLNGLNIKLNDWIILANEVVEKALSKCTEILDKLKADGRGEREAVRKAAEELHSKADSLRLFVVEAKKELTNLVEKALSQVVEFDRAIRTGLKNTKDNIKIAMEKYVKKQLLSDIAATMAEITGANEGDGLKQIIERVQEYAKKFSEKETFRNEILKQWINRILVTEPVQECLKQYAETPGKNALLPGKWNSPGRKFSEGTLEEIASKISEQIEKTIPDAFQSAGVQSLASIESHVGIAKRACDAFAMRLGDKIKTDNGMRLLASEVSKTIERQLTGKGEAEITAENVKLRKPVYAVIYQLVGVANKTAEALESFSGETDVSKLDIGKLHAAYKVAEGLEKELMKATKPTDPFTPVQPIPPSDVLDKNDTYSYDRKILGILDSEIGMENDHGRGGQVESVVAKSFDLYETYLSQSSVANGKLGDADNEGKLPEAIKSIVKEVNGIKHLGLVEDGKHKRTTNDNFNKDTFANLCNQVTEAVGKLCDVVRDLILNSDGDDSDHVGPYLSGKKGLHILLKDLEAMLGRNKGISTNIFKLNTGLQTIHDDIQSKIIGDARNADLDKPTTLTDVIAAAQIFYSETIRNEINECISDITAKLKEEVTDKIDNLKKSALTQFAKRKTAELEELKKFVHDQKNIIDNIIFTNQTTGLKGLMNTIGTNLQAYVDPLRYPNVKDLSKHLDFYFNPLFTYIISQTNPSSQLVADLQSRTHALLTHLHDNNRTFTFDSGFRSLLHGLTTYLSTFNPAGFANPHHPQLLDALKAGMQGLVGEMEKAYVNRYDGHPKMEWTTQNKEQKDEITADATRCAKVFMSCLPMWVEDLGELKRRCEGSWSKKAIHLKDEIDKENPLGEFLKQCGYRVPTSQKSHQDGELQCRHTFTGKHIDGILGKIIQMSNLEHVPQCRSREKEWNFNIMDFIACLYSHLDEYNEVCHLSTLFSKRHPCSIYEILCWFSGLPHSTVYSALPGGITKLLDKPKKQAIDSGDSGIEIEFDDENAYYLDAHPHKFTYKDIYAVIELICSKSYDVLARIAGTGDEHTRYACEYANNSLKLHYPKTADDCLPMLLDMLRRLLSVFRFLESKCSYSAVEFGWADCQYGKNVPTTKSHCNDRSTDEATCQAECKPKRQSKCQPNSQPNCQPTSPLMSYLNDCLPGHLPHQLTNVGCKSECKTCPGNKPGMPCLTPLGFRGFSGSIKTGEQLCSIIKKILGNGMIACLFTLAPRPPTTLPEHFQFAVSLAKGLDTSKQSKVDGIKTLADTIANSINASSIKLYENTNELTTPMCKAYGNTPTEHRSPNRTNNKLNLSCISLTTSCISQEHCVPYLSPLSCDTYHYLVNKQSNSYLSWAVYLPWTFHKYLASLLDAFKAIRCEDWGCSNCLHTDICKGESHGMLNPAEKGTGCQCTSVVHCNGVSPTLYQYGFTFRDAQNLISLKRNCFNMRSHLYNVVNSDYFTELFKQCDMLLWRIREPFSYLVLTLWLLSSLYLLHIKSHLHSPSSHRIAAQSLLAAARVGKFAKISYLQP